MGFTPRTFRRRFFENICGNPDAKAQHGHCMEYFIAIITIIANIGFVIGSYCFGSPSNAVYAFGDWLFIIGSVVNVACCAHSLVEQMHALKKSKEPIKDHERDEIKETVLFIFSAICFIIGCVFFLPGMTNGVTENYIFAGVGAWLCILGSFGLVVAVFYNAIGFECDHSEHGIEPKYGEFCAYLHRIGMFLLLFGGVFFVIGSFMYRPMFAGRCPPMSTDLTCMAVKSYGTHMYIAGSYCFTVESLLALTCLILKDRHQLQDPETLGEAAKLNA